MTRETLIWNPFAHWRGGLCPSSGWLRWGVNKQSKLVSEISRQVEEMYSGDVPVYIKNISSPKRRRHFDSLLKKASQVILQLKSCHLNNLQWKDVSTTYNAWEEDFAVLNIFFGQESVLGWALRKLPGWIKIK